MVLLGDPGVGKTSLASLFAEKQDRDSHEQLGGRHPAGQARLWRRIEKPVARSTGLQKADVQVTRCSHHKGIIHSCHEVNVAHLGLCRAQSGQGLEEGYWMKGT